MALEVDQNVVDGSPKEEVKSEGSLNDENQGPEDKGLGELSLTLSQRLVSTSM